MFMVTSGSRSRKNYKYICCVNLEFSMKLEKKGLALKLVYRRQGLPVHMAELGGCVGRLIERRYKLA
jgi:hypothetical protein